ncbi:MAG: FG-GAP repeat domain-containing protein, partial [Bacteroidota bacterium]
MTFRGLSGWAAILLASWLSASCGKQNSTTEDTLFTLLDEDETGVEFTNNLTFDQQFNIYTYRNYYNGGGVAIGDVNNDGLPDIYFNSNQSTNRLFLNKGNFKFEDITEKAGVGGTHAWSTGAAMADVNGDGWLDIYVCNSGDVAGDLKANELFINNGDLTFTDKAAAYRVDDQGFTTHSVFFDYDRDGDLDLY